MKWKNESNFTGIDIITEKDGIYIIPCKVQLKDVPNWMQNGNYKTLPFMPAQLQEVLATTLKEKAYQITGNHFFGFGNSSFSWDDFRGRMNCYIKWCYSAPVDHPVHKKSATQRREEFIELLWEALEIIEGTTTLKKRLRQVRDALNKCVIPDKIEEIGHILGI